MTLRIPLLGLCLCAVALCAGAQNNHPQVEDLIKFGGHLQVLAEQCSEASAQELGQAKEDQQSFAVQEFGVSQQEFQALFSQGLREAQAEWDNTSPMDRQAICDDVNDPDGG